MIAQICIIIFHHKGLYYGRLNDLRNGFVAWWHTEGANLAAGKKVVEGTELFYELEEAFVQWNSEQGITFNVIKRPDPEGSATIKLVDGSAIEITFSQGEL